MNELKTNAKFASVMVLLFVFYYNCRNWGFDSDYKTWAAVSSSILVMVWAARSIIMFLIGAVKEWNRKKELEKKERIRKEKEEEEKKRKEKEVKKVVKKVKDEEA